MPEQKHIIWSNIDLDLDDWYDDLHEEYPALGEEGLRDMMYQYNFSIPHHGFHALRHTFATRALECGMDVKTLSEILRHKNSVVTLNRYAHSLMPHKHAAMNRLGKLF